MSVLKTRMHSSRMRPPPALYHTGGSLSRGVFVQGWSLSRGSLSGDGSLCPWRPPHPERDPRKDQKQRPPLEGTWDQRQRPPEGTWDQRQRPPGKNMGPGSETEVTSYRTPPPPPEGTWDQRQRPPGRNLGPGSETEVTSYRNPLVDRQTLLKTLPCTKLRLRAVKS